MNGSALSLEWRAPGPVSAAYMRDRARVSLINGPVGSAKTTTTLMKLIRLAMEQPISRGYMGVGPGGRRMPTRRFRVCVVRDTYRMLWRTTLPSWWSRIPRNVGEFTGGQDAPAKHLVTFALSDGSLVEFEAHFVAIGEMGAEEALQGYEVTAFYLNEMNLLSRDVLQFALTRTGRFPPRHEVDISWDGVLGDFNAPELGNWVYADFFNRSPEDLAKDGAALFVQPSGLSPQAENLHNLKKGYYEDMVRGAEEWLIARMVKNIPGYSRAGKPVYPEYNDGLHAATATIEPYRGLPLIIGLDAGGHPAAAFTQRLPSGKWVVLDELVGEAGTGARRFGEMLARRLAERFSGCLDIVGYADPSAAYGADVRAGEHTWIEIVAAQSGIVVRAAPTNRPIARWEAVRLPLTRMIDGQPGFVLSPNCMGLRKGFNSDYRFRKLHGSEERYDEQADKNDASHVHDALQYALSGGGEDVSIRERHGDNDRRSRAVPRQAPAWDVYGEDAA